MMKSCLSMSTGKGYLPAFLPKPPDRIISYTEKTLSAPHCALRGVAVHEVEPESPVSRTRIRMYSVGSTNRWRSPKLLEGDFLGLSQAVKSVAETKNSCIANVKADKSYSTFDESEFPGSAQGRSSRISRPFTSPSIEDLSYSRSTKETFAAHKPFASHIRKPPIPSSRTSRTRFKDPIRLLQMFTRLAAPKHEPDMRLHCLGEVWLLHQAYVVKSKVLKDLVCNCWSDKKPLVYNDGASERLDSYISQAEIYSNDYKEVTQRLSSKVLEGRSSHQTEALSGNSVIDVQLHISDQWITKHALAIALGHLYLDDSIVSTGDAIETLATACSLQFKSLIEACNQVMISNLATDTVCAYLQAADKYKQESVVLACERWLELNLVPQLSYNISIKYIPIATLNKVLQSSRLFTYNEYSLYKMLCIWLFMQIHPDAYFLPSLTAIMTYFSSLTRTSSFLEREEGVPYSTVFNCLRLHGITDTKHLQDLMYMNILPQSWLLRVLSHHYHAMQGGGDMSFLLNFSLGANRYGFILNREPGYHSEVISLHGFHFEVKARRHGLANTYLVYFQRLRPTDASLSMRACDRSVFSMRRDRLLRYSITAQYATAQLAGDTSWRVSSTGLLEQRFGLDHKNARSQVLRITEAQTPIYVSFAIFFPPS